MKIKIISALSIMIFAIAAYAGSNYRVTLGVTPGCQSGATMQTTVWAEGEFAACDIAKNKTFPYCCGAVKQ